MDFQKNWQGIFGESGFFVQALITPNLNARFLSGFRVQDPVDEDNEDGVWVGKVSRIPGLLEHMFKASVGVDLWQKLLLGIDGVYICARFFRGDESN